MRVSKHVENLLREGRKPRELLELGFSKHVVTRVRRQLKEEKASSKMGASKVPTSTQSGLEPAQSSVTETPPTQPVLASLERRVQHFESRLEKLEALVEKVEEIDTRLNGTPALGLKREFKCSCGASGLVAIGIKCTQCGRETYWGWWPKKE